jgi:hypothetical protein
VTALTAVALARRSNPRIVHLFQFSIMLARAAWLRVALRNRAQTVQRGRWMGPAQRCDRPARPSAGPPLHFRLCSINFENEHASATHFRSMLSMPASDRGRDAIKLKTVRQIG